MCLAVLLLLSGMGAASASDVLAAQSEALDLDALQDAAGGYLPDGALEAGISLDEGLQTILNTGSGQISGVVRKAVRSGVLLLTVVLLCGLAEGLYGGMGVSQTTDVVAIVGALAITPTPSSEWDGRRWNRWRPFQRYSCPRLRRRPPPQALPVGQWPANWPPCSFPTY